MAEQKIALITGANKGIGKEVARQLGKQGITVLVGARDAERGQAAATELTEQGIDAKFVQIDVTDAASVKAAAEKISSEYGKLDILINNAGIVRDNAPASELDVELMRETYETNVFGVVTATQAFVPLLKKSDAGRIVNVSSGLGSLTQNSDPNWAFNAVKPLAYNTSKAALNMATVIFAAELKDSGIKVNAADPGYTATDLNQNSGPQPVEVGAISTVYLATLPSDGPTGSYFDKDGVVAW